MEGRGLLFEVVLHPMTQLTWNQVAIRPGDSHLMIGYQVDLLSPGWQSFTVWSHLFDFMGKVSTLTHFPLDPGCEDYCFLDHSWRLWAWPWLFPKALLTHQNWMHLLMRLIPCLLQDCLLLSTISDISRLQLAPSIQSYKLWCQARALLLPGKMSTSKLIHYFSS